MNQIQKVFKKIDLYKGMSVSRAIIRTQEYLDDQSDPTKAANAILASLEVPVPYIEQPSKANLYAVASVEQALVQDTFDPVATSKIVELKFNKIRAKMPYCFNDTDLSVDEVVKKGRKGAKRVVATQIYNDNRDKDEKEIIALISEELGVTMQNAYTYLYLIKKSVP